MIGGFAAFTLNFVYFLSVVFGEKLLKDFDCFSKRLFVDTSHICRL